MTLCVRPALRPVVRISVGGVAMAFDLGTIAAGVKILGGLKGLFGKKKKDPTPAQNIVSQAQGAREAAEKYGFNPLTMLQYGQPGGALAAGGGAAPLASFDILTEGLKGLDDIVSGDAARRRAADQLELDLARLKLDQARSGVVLHRDNVTDADFPTLSPLGRSNATYKQSNVRAAPAPFSLSNPIAPGREKEVDPLTNSPGVFEIENELTGGPITLPGDGEPWGADEALTGLAFGGPQIARNHSRNVISEVRKGLSDKDVLEKQRKEAAKHHPVTGSFDLWRRVYRFFN